MKFDSASFSLQKQKTRWMNFTQRVLSFLVLASREYTSEDAIHEHISWFGFGCVWWSEAFSKTFLRILEEIYDAPDTAGLLWESIFMAHLDQLKMKIRRYGADVIFEFDTLDELRRFDESYIGNTRSPILSAVAAEIHCSESDVVNVQAYKSEDNAAAGFTFEAKGTRYLYQYTTMKLEVLDHGKGNCAE